MSEQSKPAGRIVLTWDQIVALYVGFNRRDRTIRARQEGGFFASISGNASILPPPPCPGCPVCGVVSQQARWSTSRISMGRDIEFHSCGHHVHAAEPDLVRLWERTQYRPWTYERQLGFCACEHARCPGCWLGSDLEGSAPSDRVDKVIPTP